MEELKGNRELTSCKAIYNEYSSDSTTITFGENSALSYELFLGYQDSTYENIELIKNGRRCMYLTNIPLTPSFPCSAGPQIISDFEIFITSSEFNLVPWEFLYWATKNCHQLNRFKVEFNDEKNTYLEVKQKGNIKSTIQDMSYAVVRYARESELLVDGLADYLPKLKVIEFGIFSKVLVENGNVAVFQLQRFKYLHTFKLDINFLVEEYGGDDLVFVVNHVDTKRIMYYRIEEDREEDRDSDYVLELVFERTFLAMQSDPEFGYCVNITCLSQVEIELFNDEENIEEENNRDLISIIALSMISRFF